MSAARTRSSTITIPPPPRAPPRSPGDDHHNSEDCYPRALRASSREPSGASTPTGTTTGSAAASARNRRRSLSNIALMDNITNLQASSSSSRHHAAHSRSHSRAHSQSFSTNTMPSFSFPAALTVPHHPSQPHPIGGGGGNGGDLMIPTTTITNTVLPTLSPSAPAAYEAYSPDRPYLPGQPKSLSGIALRAFGLGAALALGATGTLVLVLTTSSPLWRLPFFLAALATFHFLEFWTTARYNTREADVSSFLLTANWPAYAIAHTTASLECLVANVFFPPGGGGSGGAAWYGLLLPFPRLLGPCVTAAGVALVVVGQVVRSAAMAQAGPSFNHIVQQTQKREHIIVTTGIYGALRHPSYFGFFWWGLGTQLAMGNALCLVAYAAVLWRFFAARIRHEEVFLVKFFGDEYIEYRKRVGTKIPFVP